MANMLETFSAGLTNRGALFRLAAHIPGEVFGKNVLSFYYEKYNEA